jgi:uncharacterized protein
MSGEVLHRQFSTEIEVRSGGDGRTLTGIVVPFGRPTSPDSGLPFTETFRQGAFARTIADRGSKVKLLVAHDSQALPIGRASLLREDRAGLYGEFRVSATPRGDEVIELARDGALDAFSVGFVPLQDQWSSDRQERTVTEAKLLEVSAVTWGAYPDARVLAVRSGSPDDLNLRLQVQRLELLRRRDPAAFVS